MSQNTRASTESLSQLRHDTAQRARIGSKTRSIHGGADYPSTDVSSTIHRLLVTHVTRSMTDEDILNAFQWSVHAIRLAIITF